MFVWPITKGFYNDDSCKLIDNHHIIRKKQRQLVCRRTMTAAQTNQLDESPPIIPFIFLRRLKMYHPYEQSPLLSSTQQLLTSHPPRSGAQT